MSGAFTRHVQELEPGREEPPGWKEMWGELKNVLVRELRRKSLWNMPPRFLGIYGEPEWSLHGDALEELLHDCYIFVFLDRLGGLKDQLLKKDNVEGLVIRNIRNFLYDTQKRYDPLGFRVFVTAQKGVRGAVEAGALFVVGEPSRVRNDTVLGFTPDADRERADRVDLSSEVRSWNDELLPDLVIARGKRRDEIEHRLADLLAELAGEDIKAFRFRDVVTPLKNDARARWIAMGAQEVGEAAFEDADEELVGLVRSVRPSSDFEDREAFVALAECVELLLEQLEESGRMQDYCLALLLFLRIWVAEDSNGDLAPDAEQVPEGFPELGVEKLPSARKLGELLRIPRGRLPALYGILGESVTDCQEGRRA